MDNRQFDLTGQRFGKLTVISFDRYENHTSYWLCQCDCGGQKVVARMYLQNGRTKSCGCIRGKGNHHSAFKPRNLNEKEIKWFIEHYKHTNNADICVKLRISGSFLQRLKRKYGLSKSKQFMRKKLELATERATASHKLHGTYPPKGYIIPRSVEFRYEKGHEVKETAAQNRKRREKMSATRKQTIKEEKARISFGLKQRTNLHLIRQNKNVVSLRHNLRERGYVIERGSMIAYYTPDTNRSEAIESRKNGDRNYVAFQYKPYEVSLGQ